MIYNLIKFTIYLIYSVAWGWLFYAWIQLELRRYETVSWFCFNLGLLLVIIVAGYVALWANFKMQETLWAEPGDQ